MYCTLFTFVSGLSYFSLLLLLVPLLFLVLLMLLLLKLLYNTCMVPGFEPKGLRQAERCATMSSTHP